MDIETLTLTVYGRSRSFDAREHREKVLRDLIAEALASKEVRLCLRVVAPQEVLVFSNCDNSMRENDWRCRMR